MMDPALTSFDVAKVGAVLADMVVCFLAAGASLSDPESANDHASQDCRSTSIATSLHLHPPVDAWRRCASIRRARTANTIW